MEIILQYEEIGAVKKFSFTAVQSHESRRSLDSETKQNRTIRFHPAMQPRSR